MSDTDLTPSPGPDLPTVLHLLAAHITENPIPRPYGIFPLWSGGVRITFHGTDMDDALRFAATLSGPVVGADYYPPTDERDRGFYGVTVNGTVLGLRLEVVVNPDSSHADTVESVTKRVERVLAKLAAESRETTALVGAES